MKDNRKYNKYFTQHESLIKRGIYNFNENYVVNYSTEHELAPQKEPLIRATANIAMTCSTHLADKAKLKDRSSITRRDLICKINYVSHVNPGRLNIILILILFK